MKKREPLAWYALKSVLVGVLVPTALFAVGWVAICTNIFGINYGVSTYTNPQDGYSIQYQASTKSYELKAQSGGGGGVTTFTAGTGISGAIVGTTLGVSNTGILGINAGTNVTLTGPSANPTISATAGAGGVSSVTAGAGISVGTSGGTVTVTNTGVTSVIAGTNITLTGPSGSPTISAPAYGITAGTIFQGNDRSPPLDTWSATTDITTLNSGTSAHGLLKKLDNTATHYMDGTGAWSTPAGTGVTGLNAGTNITLTGPSTNPTVTAASPIAGTGISVSGTTVTNAGVTSILAGTNITVSGATGAVTVTGPTALPPNGSASGDLGSTYPSPTVVNLHFGSDARGDMPVHGASVYGRVGIGGTNTAWTSNGTDPSWTTINDSTLASSYIKADGTRALTGNWDPGAFAITHGSGATAIDLSGSSVTATTANFDTIRGKTTNGTTTLKPNGTGILTVQSGAGGYRNLQIVNASSTTATISADALDLLDSSGNVQTMRSVSATLNFGGTGANGLDTGSVAIDTKYAIFGYYDLTAAGFRTLASASLTPTLPNSSTNSKRIGWLLTKHSGATLIVSVQTGNMFLYENTSSAVTTSDGNRVLSAGTATTFTAQSLSSRVPSTSMMAFVITDVINTNTSPTAYAMNLRATGSTGAPTGHANWSSNAGLSSFEFTEALWAPLNSSQSLDYDLLANNTGSLDVLGYLDNI